MRISSSIMIHTSVMINPVNFENTKSVLLFTFVIKG